MGLGTQAHFSKNGPGERQNWKNQQRNGRGAAGRTAVTDKTLSPVTGDSGSEPISVLSRPVGKHSLRDLRSCPWQLSPSLQLLPPGPVKSRAWGEKNILCSDTGAHQRPRRASDAGAGRSGGPHCSVQGCAGSNRVLTSTRLQLPRPRPSGVGAGGALRESFSFLYATGRVEWQHTSHGPLDGINLSVPLPIRPLSHVPTSDCPGILGRRTRPRAVAVNASSKACVCTSTTLV